MIGHMHHIQFSETKELFDLLLICNPLMPVAGPSKKGLPAICPKKILPKGLGSVGNNHVTCVSQLVTIIYQANILVIPLST